MNTVGCVKLEPTVLRIYSAVRAAQMFGQHSRVAIGFFVAGFLVFGAIIAEGAPVLNLAFLVVAGTMKDIRISRL